LHFRHLDAPVSTMGPRAVSAPSRGGDDRPGQGVSRRVRTRIVVARAAATALPLDGFRDRTPLATNSHVGQAGLPMGVDAGPDRLRLRRTGAPALRAEPPVAPAAVGSTDVAVMGLCDGGTNLRRARRTATDTRALGGGGGPFAVSDATARRRVRLGAVGGPPLRFGVALAAPLLAGSLAAQTPLDTLPLQLAPLRVSAPRLVGAQARTDTLPRTGLNFAPLASTLPAVQADARGSLALGERLIVRGFGARAAFGLRGVHVRWDGLPLTLPDGQTAIPSVDPAAVARVELLRGPASALFGNAAGGALALVSPPPPSVPWQARLWASTGATHRRTFELASAPAPWWLRMYATGAEDPGARAYDRDRFRQLLLQLGHRGRRSLDARALWTAWAADNPGALPDSLWRRDPRAAFPLNVQQRTGERGEERRLALRVRSPLGGATAEMLVHGARRSIDNPIPPRIVALARTAGGARLEARGGSTTFWAVGLEHHAQRDDRRNYRNDRGVRGALVLDQREQVRATALFGQLQTPLPGRLRATAGVRADRLAYRVRDRFVTRTDPDDSGRRVFVALSPSLALAQPLGVGWELTLQGATAFEAPTTTELTNRPDGAGGLNPDLQPQRTRALELGLRRTGARWAVDLALHHADIRGLLVPFEVPTQPGRSFYRNAGAARHQGAELLLWARGPAGLEARLVFSRLDARYRRYSVAGQRYDGRRLPALARDRAVLELGWLARRADVRLTWQARSRVPTDDANRLWAPGAGWLDLRVGGRWRRPRLVLEPWVEIHNVTDRRYVASVVPNAAGGRAFEPGPPRRMTIALRLSWDVVPPATPAAAPAGFETRE